MSNENLADLLELSDEQEDFCAICLCELPDVSTVHGFCQKCGDGVTAAIVSAIQDC